MKYLSRFVALTITCFLILAVPAKADQIWLRNLMKGPVWVRLRSTNTGVITQFRLRQNQAIPFQFASEEFEVQLIPEDRLDTTFCLGRLPFRDLATSLSGSPLVLRGQNESVFCANDGLLRRARVAVHVDIATPNGLDTLSAFLEPSPTSRDGLTPSNGIVRITSFHFMPKNRF